MEKEFMKKIRHNVKSKFQRELLWKKWEVIIEKYKYLFNNELEVAV